MLQHLVGLFPISCWDNDNSEQNEEACCYGCEAREKVCGARTDRVYKHASRGISEGLCGTVAQKSDGEYASQEGVGHPLLEDGVGRNVVYAGGGPLYRQGTEGEDEGGSQSRSDQRTGPDEDTQEVQEHQVDPAPQHGHHGGTKHHAAPPEAHQQPVTRVPGSEGLLGEEHLRWDRRVDRQYGEEGPHNYRQRYARTEEVAEPGSQVAHEACLFLALSTGVG